MHVERRFRFTRDARGAARDSCATVIARARRSPAVLRGRRPHGHDDRPGRESTASPQIARVSGGAGIRTLGTGVTRTTVFKTAAFNRSATPPEEQEIIARRQGAARRSTSP